MNRFLQHIILLFVLSGLLWGCAGTLQPMHTDEATRGIVSKSHSDLTDLPAPQEKVVAAVYRFRDQTGQYKPSQNIASWSTAVTQGATSILIKAMEDSGWFLPIEREGISNLLNERQIIQSIRSQHSGPDGPAPLPPLLFAGVMLEGGVIGFDSNVVTGGLGARYLGTGGSNNFRKDQVTIYLRAVSTQSGRVLKTVHTTKSIISQQLESGIFRFIDTDRLLEAEAGFTYNEPPVMAVTEAIDEAVKLLILEGIDDGVWAARDTSQVALYREKYQFEKQKEEQLQRDYFGFMEQSSLRRGWFISPGFSVAGHEGNFANTDTSPGASLQVERSLSRLFSAKANFQRTSLGADNAFSEPVSVGELLLNLYATPEYSLSPFIAAGGGVIAYDEQHEFLDRQFFPALSFEAGFDYRLNELLGFRISANYRYLLYDGVDGVSQGSYNDQVWSANAGIVINPKVFRLFSGR